MALRPCSAAREGALLVRLATVLTPRLTDVSRPRSPLDVFVGTFEDPGRRAGDRPRETCLQGLLSGGSQAYVLWSPGQGWDEV